MGYISVAYYQLGHLFSYCTVAIYKGVNLKIKIITAAVIGVMASAFIALPASAAVDQPCHPITTPGSNSRADIVVMGDSTGDATDEWVYKLTEKLLARYPAAEIRYTSWSKSSEAYHTSTQLRPPTSSTAPTIQVWNASASGQSSRYHLARLSKMLPKVVSLMIVSHGHNEDKNYVSPYTPYPADDARYREQMENLTTQAEALRPVSQVCLQLQNPRINEPTIQAQRIVQYRSLADEYGYGVTDIHSLYTNYASWQTQWMEDSTHPNVAGEIAWADRTGRQIINGLS